MTRSSRVLGDGSGHIDISSMKSAEGQDLTSTLEFIHPDDDNAQDQTVIRVSLAKPIAPHGTITLLIDFTAQLPRVLARTGYYQNFFMIAQWFPKIGVYEVAGQRFATKGSWNCHQFHSTTEFYADFGVYDVSITVPARFTVGATGTLEGEKANEDTTKTLTFHAEDVHDFAWTASPLFIPVNDRWQGVEITALMQPQRRSQAARYLSSAKTALDYFDVHVGKYPYRTLTIVDPAYGAFSAGGMEYPTLITADALWGVGEWLRGAEVTTVHEFGHQYWYGMVANNEFEEAWLDEGVNAYFESRIMDETYGPKTAVLNLLGFRMGDFEMIRNMYTAMANPKLAPTATFAWKFPGGYGSLTYDKTAVFLTTLERMIGRAAMDSVFRTYFQRWQFKHPCGRDFIAVFNEIVPRIHGNRFGANLNWFFDQVLYGTDVCDYELTSIHNVKLDGRWEGATAESLRTTLYESKIMVSRLGEIQLPVTVLVRFENGNEVREEWDGKARTAEFTYRRDVPVTLAQVDPDHLLAMDINYNNNSKTAEPLKTPIWKYTMKLLFWIQNVFQSFAFLG